MIKNKPMLLYSLHYLLCFTVYAVYSVHCTVHFTLYCTAISVQYTLRSVWYRVCYEYTMLNINSQLTSLFILTHPCKSLHLFPYLCTFILIVPLIRLRPRCRRFRPWSHPRWRIMEISNCPPNLSAKQSELTVRTKKTRPPRKKPISWGKRSIFSPKNANNCQNVPKNCTKMAQNNPLRTFLTIRLTIR